MNEEESLAHSSDDPSQAKNAVLVASHSVPKGARRVAGIDFNQYQSSDMTVNDLMEGMASMGFQASAVGDAVETINHMVCALLPALPMERINY